MAQFVLTGLAADIMHRYLGLEFLLVTGLLLIIESIITSLSLLIIERKSVIKVLKGG